MFQVRHLNPNQIVHDGYEPTRMIEYLPGDKWYQAEITFGNTTLTWDGEGEPIHKKPAIKLKKSQLLEMLAHFTGTISQTVPPHAAVHVKGKKLYEYARQGIEVELPVRNAEIYQITLDDFQKEGSDSPVAIFSIHCGSGTYIRSIAKEMGDKTGYGAYLSGLVRTHHGRFDLDSSVELETFKASKIPWDYLVNPAEYIDLPILDLEF